MINLCCYNNGKCTGKLSNTLRRKASNKTQCIAARGKWKKVKYSSVSDPSSLWMIDKNSYLHTQIKNIESFEEKFSNKNDKMINLCCYKNGNCTDKLSNSLRRRALNANQCRKHSGIWKKVKLSSISDPKSLWMTDKKSNVLRSIKQR